MITFINLLINFAIRVLILMLCWNYIMPQLFSLPEISYWKAICLCLICNVLFKNTMIYDPKKNGLTDNPL